MVSGKWIFAALLAAVMAVFLTHAGAQSSIPGPRGPVVQDRMIFFEAALMNLDRRASMAAETVRTVDARLVKAEKEILAQKEKLAVYEKRIAALEAGIKKLG